ncbi:SDR family NAD(P)-dependent oxidoreductase [Hyphomonas atlantica corrig.]|uniref:SDR family NAD(P)-dependent oxidoreductase n=1 Tax=Hyphomonas atlantica TaxID=1280948 RepID=UPI0023545FBA|nr:SDR family oxidoreductase [Hyphomonas atlantica]
MGKLEGKVAVITGGGSGIGLATAKRFIDDGAIVYLFGRRIDVLENAVQQLGPNARAIPGDVTRQEDLDHLYAQVEKEHDQIDILFANAGLGDLAALGDITPEQFDLTFGVNVKGTLFTVQKALPLLKAGSSIILTGSTTGVMGTPAFSVYSASKAAIRNFARSWAQDLRGSGIRVNVLVPGGTETETVMRDIGADAMNQIGASSPLGRLGYPTETAAVAAFLASEDSSYMTGGEVFVDGGLAQV